MLGIQHLIDPLDLDTFLTEYNGRKAVLIPGAADKFPGFFGWEDITHVLNYSGVGYPTVKFVNNRQGLPAEALQRADHWLKQGATLVISHVQNFDPVVERFCSALGRDMNTRINVNSYTSWPANQGFDTHYDRHDVFIVHLAGDKEWAVFEPTIKHPLERETGPQGKPPEDAEPYLECTLTPGDVLYIPRGHWHYAISKTPCIHFTVGPVSRSGIDFLAWLVDQLYSDEFLRRDFPVVDAAEFGGGRNGNALQDHLAAFKKKLTEALEDEALMGRFIQYCMITNPIDRRFQLPQYVALEEQIDRETPFVPHPDQKVLFRYDDSAHKGVALVRGHVLNLQDVPETFVDYVFRHEGPVTGHELLRAFPELRWKQVKGFLLAMYNHGVLQVAAADA